MEVSLHACITSDWLTWSPVKRCLQGTGLSLVTTVEEGLWKRGFGSHFESETGDKHGSRRSVAILFGSEGVSRSYLLVRYWP